jgi:hypothetical protein
VRPRSSFQRCKLLRGFSGGIRFALQLHRPVPWLATLCGKNERVKLRVKRNPTVSPPSSQHTLLQSPGMEVRWYLVPPTESDLSLFVGAKGTCTRSAGALAEFRSTRFLV